MSTAFKLEVTQEKTRKILENRSYTIYPDGPEDAEIVLVGETPGSYELSSGKPFSGPSGRMLFDDLLIRSGIVRSQCLVLNAYWDYPPGGKTERIEDITRDHARTLSLIQKHPRKVVIPMGGEALNLFTGEHSVSAWRGSIIRTPSYILFPMYNPAAVLHQYSLKTIYRHDCLRLKALLDDPNLADFPRNIRHPGNTSCQELTHLLEEMRSAPIISFDIETHVKTQTITCVGLSSSADKAIVIPLTQTWDWESHYKILRVLKEVLEGPSAKIGQNLDYDVQHLWHSGIGVRNVWLDTMIAHATIQPELPHDLGFLTSWYTLHPYYKEMRKSVASHEYSETQWRYNGIDAAITFDIGIQLAQELYDTNTWDYFHKIAMPAQKTLIRMEHKGVLINEDLRNKRRQELTEGIDEILTDPILEDVNPNSSKQIAQHLEDKLLPPSKQLPRTDKGNPKCDVHVLKSLRRTGNAKTKSFVDAVLAAREKRKLISTYLNAKTRGDNRMHCSYRVATKTGRISSSQDPFQTGMNLQNIPKSQRDWFIPDRGMIFWEADLSQVEARLTAWLYQDKDYMDIFLEGRDVHTENAAILFEQDFKSKEEANTKIEGTNYSPRHLGKIMSHSLDYKGTWNTVLKEMLNKAPGYPFEAKDAKRAVELFHQSKPKLKKGWENFENHLKKDRTVYSPFGHRRVFLDRWSDDLLRDAIAHMPQHCAAAHLLSALCRIESRLKKECPKANLLIQVHDSIGGQCPYEDLPAVKQIVIDELEKPFPIKQFGHTLSVPADFSAGRNWGAIS